MSVRIVIALIDLVVVIVLIIRRVDVRLVLLAGTVPLFAVSRRDAAGCDAAGIALNRSSRVASEGQPRQECRKKEPSKDELARVQ